MNFPLQKLCILIICSKILLYFCFLSLHHIWTTFAAFSLYFGFTAVIPLPPVLALFILNLLFFWMLSWAKSTTPPLSNLIFLKIVLSSVLGPFALSIANDTYKNLFFRLVVLTLLFPSNIFAFVKVFRSNFFLGLSLSLKLRFSSSESCDPFRLDNNILLNLFIFCNTLYLSLNKPSWFTFDGIITW